MRSENMQENSEWEWLPHGIQLQAWHPKAQASWGWHLNPAATSGKGTAPQPPARCWAKRTAGMSTIFQHFISAFQNISHLGIS